jgi:hypothetical protein
VRFALTVAGIGVWLPYVIANPIAIDGHAYFVAPLDHPYGRSLGDVDAYLYSPAFVQALEPLRWLGWDAVRICLRLASVVAIAWFAGPFTGPLLFVPPVALEVNVANIDLLIAAAIVAGFRYPGGWAFVLLTKVTPGVGLIWFAARREWRSLALAVLSTGAIAAISLVIAPSAWSDWVSTLMRVAAGGSAATGTLIPGPLSVRLVVASLIVAWGARSDRRWAVIVAAYVALPAPWVPALAMLLGVTRLEPRLSGLVGSGIDPVRQRADRAYASATSTTSS